MRYLIDLGLLCMRVGIGVLLMTHGYEKFLAGPTQWALLGQNMRNFGIYIFPMFWGFCAACAEFFGGFCIAIGLGTRIAAFFAACVMIVALSYHLKQGDSFRTLEYALALLIIFIGFMLTGAGLFSIDALLTACAKK